VRVLAVAIAAAAALAVGGFVTPAGAQSSQVPGVTAKQIDVGALVALTNPTGSNYQDAVTAAKAYFDQVNKRGGLYGRKLVMKKTIDDQTRTSKDILGARSLVEESNVFAILPVATSSFTGADYLAGKGTPTFGLEIQSDWAKGPNLFGSNGSYICFDCPQIPPVYTAQQVGAKKVAIFAYGSSSQSADCADITKQAFDKWGPKVALVDKSFAFGFSANDISGAVQAIKDQGVDFVSTCMDLQGEVNLQKALQASGVTGVKFYAPNGYMASALKDFGSSIEGFTFAVRYLPFELASTNKEMTSFVKAMKAHGLEPSENALTGWENAALLVAGIKAAGKNFTQQSVVAAVNNITDWSTNGIRTPINWKTAHGPAAPGDQECWSYIAVKGGKFVPVYGQPGKPFVCFPVNPYPATLDNPTYAAGG